MILTLMLLGIQSADTMKTPLSCEQIDLVFGSLRKETLPVPRTATDIQITAHESLCGGWEIIDVWSTYANAQKTWHARRKQMDRTGRLTVTFTNSSVCPAFFDALVKLSDLKIGLTVAYPNQKVTALLAPPPPPSPDGTYYELQILDAHQADGTLVRVQIGAHDGAIADWAEKDLAKARGCWQGNFPS